MAKTRVLVVDDSALTRRLVSEALATDPSIEVAGTASNGRIALSKLAQLNPDVVTLDVEMPELDGIETLVELRKTHPRLPVIMFSAITERGAAATLEAMARGASDYVTKPSTGSFEESRRRIAMDLVPRVKAFAPHTAAPPPPAPPPPTPPGQPPHPAHASPRLAAPPPAPGPRRPASVSGLPAFAPGQASHPPALQPRPRPMAGRAEIVAIGVSTGGPNALAELVPTIPAGFPLPIVIVQHMPPVFTKLLAERLGASAKLKVVECQGDEQVRAGHIYIAKGDFHMRVKGGRPDARLTLDQGPQENSCRPAVDVLFRSVAEVFGGAAIAVILTGMGQDGLRGCQQLRDLGATVVAQDQATSVIWGMPGAVVRAGLADRILPIQKIGPELVALTSGGLSPRRTMS